MIDIKHNLDNVHKKIQEAITNTARHSNEVKLLAVSKTKPVTLIEDAIAAGQRLFGENYVQEGIEKVDYFNQHFPDVALEWHFIGPIQSNKSRSVAEHFNWVHTIDRLKIAKRLNDQRPQNMGQLNVLIQVNTSHESNKSGCTLEEVAPIAQEISHMKNLSLKGLMCIPKATDNYDEVFKEFATLSAQLKKLQLIYPDMKVLSMGMTGDMSAAIAAGSTMVRIGTAIFGARDYNS